jgi:hypothetical protein
LLRLLRRALAALLISCLLAGPAVAGELLVIDDFEAGLGENWRAKVFHGETAYRVVAEGAGHVLRAESRGTASGLVREIELDPREYPVLSWRWKVAGTIPAGDERTKAGDDYAARVYVIFPHWFFPRTRTLNYIWANRLPVGTFLPNAYTENAMMIAVQSGPGKAGEWVSERRDIVADFRRAFGEEPPRIGALAVMTDTDNTGAAAVGWFDDLAFHAR